MGEPVLWHKDLLVGVVGGEWFLFVLDVVLLGHRRWAGGGGTNRTRLCGM